MSHPKITIVTPSLNQGQFLEDTILSLTGQGYHDLEYFVMDGGSSDNSVDIIKKYDSFIESWESGKDNGQAAAINKGFSRATGDILGWLNSDDIYLPGTLRFVSSLIDTAKAQIIFGNAIFSREGRPGAVWGSNLSRLQSAPDLLNGSLIQPSSLWTSRAWEKTGPLNEEMRFAFDLEWFNRAKSLGVEFRYVPRNLSLYRFHDERKVLGDEERRLEEISSVYVRYRPDHYAEVISSLLGQSEEIRRFQSFLRRVGVRAKSPLETFLFRRRFAELRRIDKNDLSFLVSRFTKER